MRKFEKISFKQFTKDFNENNTREVYDDIIIPNRKTKNAAGYDIYAPFDFILEPDNIIKVPTGIKVLLGDNEFLMLVVRSSLGFNYNVRMCNQVGIIDADYYNNESNEGHIWIALQNEGSNNWSVKKGDRIAQGVFMNYMLADGDNGGQSERKGGFGSTNQRSDKNE